MAESGVRQRSPGAEAKPQDNTDDPGVAAYEAAAQKLAQATGNESAPQDPEAAATIAELKATDTAVRAHEAAHVMVGGSYVRGAADFSYTTGPDGKQYAVGGEVSIDTSAEGDPQATIRKMATVRAAALAPADPSAQDRAVAAAAAQAMAAAQAQLREARATEAVAIDETETGGAQPGVPGDAAALEAAEPAGDANTRARGLQSVVVATYAAANQPPPEPTFLAAA
ncbi:MAG TPA: putative metalloprotease CJM1_0395 family protein [Opitutaceae bacterium]|nr:putative metalloprotease CJM1_0395 family protein [Opitutaceae bacterium]